MDYLSSHIFDTMFYNIDTGIDVKLWSDRESIKSPTLRESSQYLFYKILHKKHEVTETSWKILLFLDSALYL